MKSIKLATAIMALTAGLAMSGGAFAQASGGPGGMSGAPASDGGNRAGAPSGDSMMGKPDKGLAGASATTRGGARTGDVQKEGVGDTPAAGGDEGMR